MPDSPDLAALLHGYVQLRDGPLRPFLAWARVPHLTEDSQIVADLRVRANEETNSVRGARVIA
jgi:hypothetical protein